MFRDYLVSIPSFDQCKTFKRKPKSSSDITYIEIELERIYSKERKNTSTKRTTIGKLPVNGPIGKMYPNDNYYKYVTEPEYPGAVVEISRSGCLKAGAFVIVRKIIEEYGLDKILTEIIGAKDTGLFLDLAAYGLMEEDNAAQYYPDYAYCHPLFSENMHIYSDSTVCDFLHKITIDDRLSFIEEWIKRKGQQERIYLSYDSTNKIYQAGDIEIIENGKSKTGIETTIFNYSLVYDSENREPLLYEKYPGSINDVSQLEYLLKKIEGYGYRNICMILDRGYFSKTNIAYMDGSGIEFIMMVKGNKKLVNDLILKCAGQFEDKMRYHIKRFDVHGMTVRNKLYESDQKERYFHIFYSADKYAAERAALIKELSRMERELDKAIGTSNTFPINYHNYYELIYKEEKKTVKDKIGNETEISEMILQTYIMKNETVELEIKLCGYFSIISSEEMTAQEAYLRYKSRDGQEKLFRGDKSYLGNKSIRSHSDESSESKIFIEFVGLIIRNKIYLTLFDELLKNGRTQNYLTVPAAIKELNKIEIIRQPDGIYRLDHAITATQKSILKAFGITPWQMKDSVEQLGKKIGLIDNAERKRKEKSLSEVEPQG